MGADEELSDTTDIYLPRKYLYAGMGSTACDGMGGGINWVLHCVFFQYIT